MSGMARSKWIRFKSPREQVHSVCARMLRSRLKAIACYLPLAAHQAHENVEYVHQLRVWTRRAEAVVDLCRDVLSKSRRRKLRKQLDVLRDAAGAARDADVLHDRIARLRPGLAREHLLKSIDQRRREAQKPLVQLNEKLGGGQDILKLLKKVGEWLADQRRKKPLRTPFRKWSREELRPLVKRFIRRGKVDLSDLSRLHKFRIACKRLRYALELAWGALDKKQRKRAYKQLDRLQAHLGSINDRRNLVGEIEQALAATRKRSLQTQLRRLLAAERRALTLAQEQWADSWNDKKAERLARMLKQLAR